MKTEMYQATEVMIKLFAHMTTLMLVIMQNVVLVMYICNELIEWKNPCFNTLYHMFDLFPWTWGIKLHECVLLLHKGESK